MRLTRLRRASSTSAACASDSIGGIASTMPAPQPPRRKCAPAGRSSWRYSNPRPGSSPAQNKKRRPISTPSSRRSQRTRAWPNCWGDASATTLSRGSLLLRIGGGPEPNRVRVGGRIIVAHVALHARALTIFADPQRDEGVVERDREQRRQLDRANARREADRDREQDEQRVARALQ